MSLSTNNTVLPMSAREDEFELLRKKIFNMITGGTSYDTRDPDISAKILRIDANAKKYWESMERSSDRNCLWSDLTSVTISSQMSENYLRLQKLALAYSTYGSAYEGNESMLSDILGGMDWMYENRYHTGIPIRGYDNWFDWQIAAPNAINEITIMLYSKLTAGQINSWNEVMDYQALDFGPANTGANRVWSCRIRIISGIVTKNSYKIEEGRDKLSPVFAYSTSDDGFYTDGSFIQHHDTPYNGAYGSSLLRNLGEVLYYLKGSSWAITDGTAANVYRWIYDSFEPFIYKGAMMDMVRGRNMSRYNSSHSTGNETIGSIALIAELAPIKDAVNYKSMVKHWISQETTVNTYADLDSIFLIVKTKEIMKNSSILPKEELISCKVFPNMDRVLQLRDSYGFGISMFSSRMVNYESINRENLRGWHTGDGMTYLYNNDSTQYEDNFWAAVDSYRLPGTTVNKETAVTSDVKGMDSWVGGTEMSGLYGIAGMKFTNPNCGRRYDGTNAVRQSGCSANNGLLKLGGKGAYLEWDNVLAPDKGKQTIEVRYANGSMETIQCEIKVNGRVMGSVNFIPTGGWYSWSAVSIEGDFRQGSNRVRFTVNTSKSGPVLDKFDIKSSLRAKKSWFMFDDEIVCLGSDITSADNYDVETIIENRKLNGGGDNPLYVNGIKKPAVIGWSETMTGVNRIHLTGNNIGSDIGYYFPEPAAVNGLRESRSCQWSCINQYYTDKEYFTNYTNQFLALWIEHGANPAGAVYAYVLLPGKSRTQLDDYALNPDITIIENSAVAHAVKENRLGILGVNFWEDGEKTVDIIKSNKKASVMVKITEAELSVSVADPTMENNGTIELEVDNATCKNVCYCDPDITVNQTEPTIKLSVRVGGSHGKTFRVNFECTNH